MLNRQNIQDIYQLSPIQEGIYFHALMDAQTQAYFSQTVYQLSGQFEPELMRQSLGLLVQRHDVLRTVFNHKKADELLQIVLKKREADFQYIDIRNLSEESQALYVDNFKEEDRRRNFNLNKDVLLRVSLLQLGEESYEFIWSIHHIIMDGWCQSVLIEEFQQIYMALKQGRAVDLPPTSQYRQYIDWLARQAKAPAIQFWQEYLEGYEGKRSLFSSSVDAYDNCEFEEMLPKELSSQLWQLAREQGLTLSSLLQTVWGITLGKYNGQQDAVLGMVGANRPAEIPYIERAVGVFINTLPIRVHYEPTEAFLEVARRVQSDQIRMQAFGFLPLTRIQQESVLKKALVNHAFIFENLPQVGESEEEGGEQAEAKTAGSFNQTNYHFNLIVEPNAQINFKFNYNGAALSEDFVRGLAGHFLHLLQQIPKKCNDPIQQLLLIKEDESQRLLAFNGKQVAPKEPLTILDAFEKQLSKDPDAIALVGPEQRLSYRDLNERAEQMAGGLLARMSSQNDPVIAIFMDRSIESVAAMLAIWKAGATYLPLHTEWPSARLKYILKDTGAEMVLCGTERETIEDIDIPQVRITDCNGPYNQQIATRPTPTDTAYIIYTSGTSGRPKGVPIRQESIVHQINYHNDYLNMQAGDRFLHMASLSFDASLVEMLMPLFSGGSIVLAPQSIKENTAKMMDYLQAQQVDTAIFPPAYLSLIDQLEQSSLRRIISTGEAIRMEEAVRLCDKIELYNGYGPTECCIGVSFHRVEAARKEQYLEAGAIPIGQPFEGAAVYILNPERQLLPQGQIGEICVAGIGLSKGYLNRPEETDKKFVSNPFARHQGEERLYRTGDLGCWNERGEMEFHGRIDDQVQLSGIRVEPKEIEGSLQQIEGVQNAIVQQLSKEGNLLLTAFVEA
ncbi:MAG: amino acid adenylation domain-containing protein, partial [Bacteroidota bacterium]